MKTCLWLVVAAVVSAGTSGSAACPTNTADFERSRVELQAIVQHACFQLSTSRQVNACLNDAQFLDSTMGTIEQTELAVMPVEARADCTIGVANQLMDMAERYGSRFTDALDVSTR